jgi:WD40 repeat protein
MGELAGALDNYLEAARPVNRIAPVLAKRAAARKAGPAPKGPRRWPWLAAAVAAVATVLGVGIWLSSGLPGLRDDPKNQPPKHAAGVVAPKLVQQLNLPDVRGWTDLAISPDGKTLAARHGTTAELWDLTTGKLRAELKDHPGEVNFLTFSPDGKTLAAGCYKQVFLWDLDRGKDPLILRGHTNWVSLVHFDPDGKTVVSLSGRDGTLRRWDAATGEEREAVRGLRGDLTVSQDRTFICIGEALIDLRTFQTRVLKTSHYPMQFSLDNKTIGEAGRETVWLWDAEAATYQTVHELHTDRVNTAVLCPDGKTVASGSNDKTVMLYDLEAKRARTVIKAHSGPVGWVWPLPDGKTLASFSESDPAVKLWDIATGEERGSLGHDHNMKFVGGEPGPRLMVTVDQKGIAKVWDLGPEQK